MRTLVWVVALAACGDDGSGVGGDGGTKDANVPLNTGAILISSFRSKQVGTEVSNTIVNASFSPQQTSTPPCTSQTVGPCIVSQCSGPFPMQTLASGGTVTVMGVGTTATLTPGFGNMYQPVNTGASFAGGETITMQGTGADTPAFSFTLLAPARAAITTPAKPSGTDALVIDRSHDLSVAWTGGGTSEIDFVFGSPGLVNMNCAFPASAGSATIPTAALQMLSAGSGSFSASTEVIKSVDVGAWRFYGEAFFTVVWSIDESNGSVTTTLQ
ncbi:MAG TPA: hypothetical protein VMZ53_02895 [Kofleriaceae bacterium]|nr:hypothetical protein [Kofleriaceae bacterium]